MNKSDLSFIIYKLFHGPKLNVKKVQTITIFTLHKQKV